MTMIRIAKTIALVHDGLRVVVGDRLDHADDQAADHGALEVADAAHDRRGERDQAGGEALVELDRPVVERVDQARRAGQHAAEQERQRDRAVDVDAHQARGVHVLGGRAHRLAVLRAPRRTTAAPTSSGTVTTTAKTSECSMPVSKIVK